MNAPSTSIDQIKNTVIDLAIRFGPKVLVAILILFVGVAASRWVSRWLAHVHRLSGIALAIFLPLHFWALGNALQLDSFLAWTEQPLVKAGEWVYEPPPSAM